MDRELVRSRLLHILSHKEFASLQIDVSRITDETSLLNDVGLDSLQLLELVVAIENAFCFKVNTRRLDVDIFDSFGALVTFVAEHEAACAGAAHA